MEQNVLPHTHTFTHAAVLVVWVLVLVRVLVVEKAVCSNLKFIIKHTVYLLTFCRRISSNISDGQQVSLHQKSLEILL